MSGFGTMRTDEVAKLRHRMTLQKLVSGDETNRGHKPKDVWEDVAKIFGSIRGLSARESERAHQIYPSATHRVRVRSLNYANVAEMRLLFGTRELYIGGELPTDEIDRFTTLLVKETPQ